METTNRPRRQENRPPLKRFGQHFLEPAWVEKLVRVIAPTAGDAFLEIGPGRGALTRSLVARAASVIAFEIDRGLAADLRAAALPRLTVVEGDFLSVTAEQVRELTSEIRLKPADEIRLKPTDEIRLMPDPTSKTGSRSKEDDTLVASVGSGFSRIDLQRLRVAGNLPYNVASPILFKLLELYADGVPFADATVMVQREVADRLLASPGTKEYGTLTVLVGHRARVTRLLSLPPGAFRPAPRVHSTVVRLELHEPEPLVANGPLFRQLVASVFTRRRKTLSNALLAFAGSAELSPMTALGRAGIDPRRRPETLTMDEFCRLADIFDEGVRSGR